MKPRRFRPVVSGSPNADTRGSALPEGTLLTPHTAHRSAWRSQSGRRTQIPAVRRSAEGHTAYTSHSAPLARLSALSPVTERKYPRFGAPPRWQPWCHCALWSAAVAERGWAALSCFSVSWAGRAHSAALPSRWHAVDCGTSRRGAGHRWTHFAHLEPSSGTAAAPPRP